ncbi:MAG: LiaF transmembrane domain-containing protein [Smithella sp.]
MAGSKLHMLTGGLILIALGVLIYLSKANIYPFSQTWPVLIIVIGFGTIIQKASDFGGWFVTIAGVLFLIIEFYGFDFHKYSIYLLPAVLILLGIFVIFKRKK